jgi:hypothetical protein
MFEYDPEGRSIKFRSSSDQAVRVGWGASEGVHGHFLDAHDASLVKNSSAPDGRSIPSRLRYLVRLASG